MRIGKYGREFDSEKEIREYVEINEGRIRVTKGTLAEDGVKVGEYHLFAIHNLAVSFGKVSGGREPNDDDEKDEYPYIFSVDPKSYTRIYPVHLAYLERYLSLPEGSLIKPQGWPKNVPDSLIEFFITMP